MPLCFQGQKQTVRFPSQMHLALCTCGQSALEQAGFASAGLCTYVYKAWGLQTTMRTPSFTEVSDVFKINPPKGSISKHLDWVNL